MSLGIGDFKFSKKCKEIFLGMEMDWDWGLHWG